MSDREKNELAWRAYFLGVRMTLAVHDLQLDNLPDYVARLCSVAGGDNTLHDPTAIASGFSGPTAECIISIGNNSIKADTELAASIVRGFEAATNVNP